MAKTLLEELTEFQNTLDQVRKQYAADGTITPDEQFQIDALEDKINQLLPAAGRGHAGNGNGQPFAAPGSFTGKGTRATIDQMTGVQKVRSGPKGGGDDEDGKRPGGGSGGSTGGGGQDGGGKKGTPGRPPAEPDLDARVGDYIREAEKLKLGTRRGDAKGKVARLRELREKAEDKILNDHGTLGDDNPVLRDLDDKIKVAEGELQQIEEEAKRFKEKGDKLIKDLETQGRPGLGNPRDGLSDIERVKQAQPRFAAPQDGGSGKLPGGKPPGSGGKPPAGGGSGTGGSPPTSGGGSGSGTGTSDENKARIRQLDEWVKKNKIDGDVSGLRKGLQSNDPLAESEFKDADDAIKKGEKHHVEQFAQSRGGKGPKDTRISTGDKTELEKSGWLKKRITNEDQRRQFMDWLKSGHKVGEVGDEIPQDKKGTDKHEHLKPGSREAEARVQQWESETGIDGRTGKKRVTGGDPNKPKRGNGGDKPPGTGGKPGGGSGTGGSPPTSGGTKPTGGATGGGTGSSGDGGAVKPAGGGGGTSDVKTADLKAAETVLHRAQDNLKQVNDAKADPQKVQKQNAALESELATKAKQLQSHPDFKDFSASDAKKFYSGVRSKFGSVRAGAGSLAMLALNLADAYELVQQVAYILDAKSVSEFVKRGVQVGKGAAEGALVFGALRFALRGSNPAAIGVMVFIGDMDKNAEKDASDYFREEIRNMVNKVRPGSVIRLGRMGTLDEFKDEEAKKLFYEASKQAKDAMRGKIAEATKTIGHEDGLTGSKARTDFEVSGDEEKILGIDEKWREGIYKQGYAEGTRKREDAVKRAREAGFKDGKEGKEANFIRLSYDWPEVGILHKRDVNRENKPEFDFKEVYGRYESSYNDGYRDGRKTFDTRTVQKFQIAIRDVTKERYSRLPLYAHVEYSNGTKGAVSEDVTWSTDKPSIAAIAFDKGAKVTMAHLIGDGKAKVTAKFLSGGKTFEDTITVTVNPLAGLKIELVQKVQSDMFPDYPMIGPALGPYAIGDELQLIARTDTVSALPAEAVSWFAKSKPPGVLKIDDQGKAVMLKAGEAEIILTERETSPLQASVKIQVVAQR